MHCCNINKSRRGIFFWFTWYMFNKATYLLITYLLDNMLARR